MSDKWQDYYQQGTDRYISYYSDFVERFNSLLQPDIKRGRDHHKHRVRHEQEERRLEGETLNAIEEERANVQEALRMAHTGRQWATLSSMAQILVTFFDRRGYWDDWILTQRLVLDTVPSVRLT